MFFGSTCYHRLEEGVRFCETSGKFPHLSGGGDEPGDAMPRESGQAAEDCDELADASDQVPSVSALRDLSACLISTRSRLARRGCRIAGWVR
jgi:hypothetical protein